MVELGLSVRTECLLDELNPQTQSLPTSLYRLVKWGEGYSFLFTICIVRTCKLSEKLQEHNEHP